MLPLAPPLVWCGLVALPAAALARSCLPAAAALAMAGVLFALYGRHRLRFAGLCALPAMLAAIDVPRAPPPPVRGGPVRIAGTVASVVRTPEAGITSVWLDDGKHSVQVAFEGDLEVLPGDHMAAHGCASEPAAPDLPAALRGMAETVRITPGGWSIPRLAAAARRALERQLLQLLPGERGTMLATLLLGRGTRTSADLGSAHQATGLSHLLAVSGAHAAMLALMLGLLGRGQRLESSWRRTTTVLLLLFAYAVITGNEPPVLRAVVTFALAAIAVQLGRQFAVSTGLFAPAVATCLVQPAALLGASFLLSYAAVIGLCLAGPPRGEPGLRRWVAASLRGSVWATLLTGPLTLCFFGQLAPWTVLLTPLLSPLVALMLVGALATSLLGCIAPVLAELPAVPLGLLAELYIAAVRAADHLPATPVQALVTPAPWLLGLAAGAALLLIAWRPSRPRAAAAAVLLMLPHFVPLANERAPALLLFAIGHGQACLATVPGHRSVIDCGSVQHPAHAARAVAAALDRRRIDLLIVSHADQDHHNGVPFLLRRIPIGAAILPQALAGSDLAQLLADHGTHVTFAAPGSRLEPAPHLRIGAPDLPAGASDNDTGLWIDVDLGATSVLLSGDAQSLGITAAIAQGIAHRADVLVLPHHGRQDPLAMRLLHTVHPRVCLASATAADGETALGPLVRALGADLWVTGVHGTIDVRGGASPRVSGSAAGRPLPPR